MNNIHQKDIRLDIKLKIYNAGVLLSGQLSVKPGPYHINVQWSMMKMRSHECVYNLASRDPDNSIRKETEILKAQWPVMWLVIMNTEFCLSCSTKFRDCRTKPNIGTAWSSKITCDKSRNVTKSEPVISRQTIGPVYARRQQATSKVNLYMQSL